MKKKNIEIAEIYLAITETMKSKKAYPKKLMLYLKMNYDILNGLVKQRDSLVIEVMNKYNPPDERSEADTEELKKEINEIDNIEVEIHSIQTITIDDLPEEITPDETIAFMWMLKTDCTE